MQSSIPAFRFGRGLVAGAAFAVAMSTANAPGQEALERFQVDGSQANSFFGEVSYISDLDGDGVADFAVGCDRFDVGSNADVGRVFFFSGVDGSPIAVDGTKEYLEGGSADDTFGKVVRAFDLDADGIDELVVAAPSYQNKAASGPNSRDHYVRVYSGTSLRNASPAWCTITPPTGANSKLGNFGTNLADAGDVDNDGYNDLMVGRAGGSSGSALSAAYVYSGQTIKNNFGGTISTRLYSYTSSNTTDDFDGVAVSGFGDVNGDGYDDFLVGEYFYGVSNSGRVRLYSGGTGGSLTLLAEKTATVFEAAFGYELQPFTSGGSPFIAVGAPAGEHGSASTSVAGKVYCYAIVTNSPGNPYKFDPKTDVSGSIGGIFGIMMSAGDADGDGSDDLGIAARYEDVGGGAPKEGVVRVYHSSLSGSTLSLSLLFDVDGQASGDELGRLALERDITDDGADDLLLGTGHVKIDLNGDGTPENTVGRAYVVTYSTKADSLLYGNSPVAGTSGVPPSLTIDPGAVIGLDATVNIGNTTRSGGVPQATTAALWIGTGKASNPNATIQVTNYASYGFSFATGQYEYPYTDTIAFDSALIGTHIYLQAFVLDSGASGGIAISQGFDLTFGMGVPWP